MRAFAAASMVVSMAAGSAHAQQALTFDEAVALAGRTDASPSSDLLAELPGLQRSRLPHVRIEVAANTSRTLDLFSEGPLQSRFASSVLAFDYPLWDGGAASARAGNVIARLRRMAEQGGLDDARFAQLLDAFGELYLVQNQAELLLPVMERIAADTSRSAELLAKGEISNLADAERREVALAYESRSLELEARRIDAVTRLRLLTALKSEPRIVLDPSAEPPTITPPAELSDDYVRATSIALADSRARLRAVETSNGFRATLSGFAGAGTAASEFRDVHSDGAFGIYGLRVLLSYPLLRGTNAVAVAEARAEVAQAAAMRNAAVDAANARASQYRLREETSRRRLSLLQQSVDIAKAREESLQRLVAGGLRTENDLDQAEAERLHREADLLTAQVDRWKAMRLLARMTAGDAGQK